MDRSNTAFIPLELLLSVVAAAAVGTVGCAHMAHIEKSCGSRPHDDVCLGDIVVPQAKASVFEDGARAAVDAIYSVRFRTELRDFIAKHADDDGRQLLLQMRANYSCRSSPGSRSLSSV